MYSVRPSELTSHDIERAVAEQVPEGSEVELKATLPSKKGVDPWIAGEDRIGDYARNELIAEIVAFANAFGGWLLLGIEETSEKPARANKIVPIPKCAELAERLRLQCRDCIDPQIPILDAAGVATQDDGAGVVVIYVSRSRMAPHRHNVTRECYARRADRTEKMTMREIQDLTLNVERGLSGIEHGFFDRQDNFTSLLDHFGKGYTHSFGLRLTLLPLVPLHIERVHNEPHIRPLWHSFHFTVGQQGSQSLTLPNSSSIWRPLIRGTVVSSGTDHRIWSRAVYSNGLIEYQLLFRKGSDRAIALLSTWALALFANILCSGERFRSAAGAPNIEYGLEIELNNRGAELPIRPYSDDVFDESYGPYPIGKTIFPRYNVGNPSEFQEATGLFQRDFWNGAGHDFKEFAVIDFQRAFAEL